MKPQVHALALNETDQDASLETALAAAAYFQLDVAQAAAIAKDVGAVVATWREVAGQPGLTADHVDRMASAFEHADLAKAIARRTRRRRLFPAFRGSACGARSLQRPVMRRRP